LGKKRRREKKPAGVREDAKVVEDARVGGA
jgi:hypothetical protein